MLALGPKDTRYPTVEFFLDAVAGWFKKPRYPRGGRDELRQCSPEEIMKVAKDLGVPLSDLGGLAAKAPDAANDVSKMLRVLSIDESTLAKGNPATMRDLKQPACSASKKAAAGMSSPVSLPPRIFMSSAPMPTHWMHCLGRKSSRTGVDTPA